MAESFLGKLFAANVRRILELLGWSQGELARRMGVSTGVVSRMLSGSMPSLPTQQTVAGLLKVDIEDLFADTAEGADLELPVRATAGAGPGRDDPEEYGKTLNLTRLFKGAREVVHVRGDSMVEAGIHDGDIVLVKPKPKYQSKDIVVAWIHDLEGCVVKQLLVKGKNIFLNPRSADDSTATPILLGERDRIEGVCT
jgi:SOS-response transcriptional repressor LexA